MGTDGAALQEWAASASKATSESVEVEKRRAASGGAERELLRTHWRTTLTIVFLFSLLVVECTMIVVQERTEAKKGTQAPCRDCLSGQGISNSATGPAHTERCRRCDQWDMSLAGPTLSLISTEAHTNYPRQQTLWATAISRRPEVAQCRLN